MMWPTSGILSTLHPGILSEMKSPSLGSTMMSLSPWTDSVGTLMFPTVSRVSNSSSAPICSFSPWGSRFFRDLTGLPFASWSEKKPSVKQNALVIMLMYSGSPPFRAQSTIPFMK